MNPELLLGIRFIESVHLTETVPYPRSPARARRRAAKGYPQHYVTRSMTGWIKIGNVILAHQMTMALLRQCIGRSQR